MRVACFIVTSSAATKAYYRVDIILQFIQQLHTFKVAQNEIVSKSSRAFPYLILVEIERWNTFLHKH